MNINKLRAKIVEKGLNVESFSRLIGVNRSSMYRKLNNGRFTIAEALRIKEALELSTKEASDIFFN